MSVRLLLTDFIWRKIEPRLNEIKSKVGRPPDISDQTFIEAVLYVARTGIPWRDLPAWVTSRPYTTDCGVGSETEPGSNYGNYSLAMKYRSQNSSSLILPLSERINMLPAP